jgi:hypothetical protein
MISWSRPVCPIAAQVFLYMVCGLSDTLISLNGTTSFASEHRDLKLRDPPPFNREKYFVSMDL